MRQDLTQQAAPPFVESGLGPPQPFFEWSSPGSAVRKPVAVANIILLTPSSVELDAHNSPRL
jgi:hypothetical protein